MLKRYTALIVTVMLLLMLTPSYVFAADADSPHYQNAVDLKLLGLLDGTGNGFELERAATRAEGAIMLVRLLGKEKYAIQSHFSHPFTDVPSWAGNYIGYMYNTGITAGMDAETYGSSLTLTAPQYAAFVLRSLGYSENQNDFTLDTALDKAESIGLLSHAAAQGFKNGGTFTRDSVVMISYNALSVKLKGLSSTLLDKLVNEDKAVSEATAGLLGLYTSRLRTYYLGSSSFKPASTSYGFQIKSKTELTYLLKNTLSKLQQQVIIDMRSYQGDIYKDVKPSIDAALEPVSKETGITDIMKGWRYNSNGSSMTISFTYFYTPAEFETEKQHYRATVDKARLVALKTNRNMTDFEKELILHDYLVNNCAYDLQGYNSGSISDNSFKAYGCLILGKAVCQGYSEAMKLLCDLTGIECRVISGTANSSGTWEGHSWNLIKLDSDYYHLDVTFDDPVAENGRNSLSYSYFNLTDADLKASHRWDAALYPTCTSTKYNYYTVKNLIVANRTELQASLKQEAASRKTSMEFRISDYSTTQYSDMQKLISDSTNASRFYYSVDDHFGIVKIFNVVY